MSDPTQPEKRSLPQWREWDDFIAHMPDTGFMQASWWADHRAALGYDTFGAILRTEGTVVGGAVVERRVLPCGSAFYHVADGPALPANGRAAGDVFESILAMIDAQRRVEPVTVSHLRIQPKWATLPTFVHGFAAPPAADGLTESQDGASVDLLCDEHGLLARMEVLARVGITAGAANGVHIVEDSGPQGVSDFVGLLGMHGLEMTGGTASASSIGHLVPLLVSLGRGSLWFADLHGERVAAVLLFTFGRRAIAYHAGAVSRSPHAVAPWLLHFDLMRRAKLVACDSYEIRPAVPGAAAEETWPGFGAFRRGLGAVAEPRVATLDLVYDQMAYMQHMAFAAGEGVVTGRITSPANTLAVSG